FGSGDRRRIDWNPFRRIMRPYVGRGRLLRFNKQGAAMRTGGHWGLHLIISGLLAAAVSAAAIAQTAYPPTGPKIPAVTLTGGGSPPPAAAPTPGSRDRASQWNKEVVGHNDLQ